MVTGQWSGQVFMVGGQGSVVKGLWSVVNCQLSVIIGEGSRVYGWLSMVKGQWSVVVGKGSRVYGHWSVVCGQGSGVSGQWFVVCVHYRTRLTQSCVHTSWFVSSLKSGACRRASSPLSSE